MFSPEEGAFYCDLWTWNFQRQSWRLLSGMGNQTCSLLPVYGILGVADTNNFPGARANHFSVADTSGIMFIFGGRTSNIELGTSSALDPSFKIYLIMFRAV